MIGATGAVGGEVVRTLLAGDGFERLTLLGRRALDGVDDRRVEQSIVDVLDPAGYHDVLGGHDVAICTLGVGQPSRMSRERFLQIDQRAVIEFASACRGAGVRRFALLSSIGADPASRSFYLGSKGELEHALQALAFERLSLFQPSMILTPSNRYGTMQGLTLIVWPRLRALLRGPLRKWRGIEVGDLGRAIARTALSEGHGVERLRWDEITALADRPDR